MTIKFYQTKTAAKALEGSEHWKLFILVTPHNAPAA